MPTDPDKPVSKTDSNSTSGTESKVSNVLSKNECIVDKNVANDTADANVTSAVLKVGDASGNSDKLDKSETKNITITNGFGSDAETNKVKELVKISEANGTDSDKGSETDKVELVEIDETNDTISDFSEEEDFELEVVDEINDALNSEEEEPPIVSNGASLSKSPIIADVQSVIEEKEANDESKEIEVDDKGCEKTSDSELKMEEYDIASSDEDSTEDILDRLCKKEISEEADAQDKFSSNDDESLKDGIDIDSIIDVIRNEDDEMCSRLDILMKRKMEAVSKVKNDSASMSDSFSFASATDKEQTDVMTLSKENVEEDEAVTECRAILQSMCGFVTLKLDQEVTSERITAMENIIHKTNTDTTVNECSNSDDANELDQPESEPSKKLKLDTSNTLENEGKNIQISEDSSVGKKELQLESSGEEQVKEDSTKPSCKVEVKSDSELSGKMQSDEKNAILRLPKHFLKEIKQAVIEGSMEVDVDEKFKVEKHEPKKEESDWPNGKTNNQSEPEEGDVFIEILESELKPFVKSKVTEFTELEYKDLIGALAIEMKTLTDHLSSHKLYTEHLRKMMKELATSQSEVFRTHGYNPKVEKRTVGVNVRIIPQVDKSKSHKPLQLPVNKASTIITGKPTTTIIPSNRPVPSNIPLQVLLTSPTASNSVIPTSAQSFALQTSVKQPSIPTTTSVVLLASNPITATTASQPIVDLTDDDPPKQQLTVVSSPVKPTTNVRAALPPKPTSAPPTTLRSIPMLSSPSLPSVVHQLPQGTTITSTVRTGLPPTRFAYVIRSPSGSALSQPPRIISNLRHPFQAIMISSVPQTLPQNTTMTRLVTPTTTVVTSSANSTSQSQLTLTPCFNTNVNKHPAPLPPLRAYTPNPEFKAIPPKPVLKMNKVTNGIVLSWNMSLTNKHADIATYQLYAYQETAAPVNYQLWKKVGEIKALPLPMACTLTQFMEGNKYHFSVRAVDIHAREGHFSDPTSIVLTSAKNPPDKTTKP